MARPVAPAAGLFRACSQAKRRPRGTEAYCSPIAGCGTTQRGSISRESRGARKMFANEHRPIISTAARRPDGRRGSTDVTTARPEIRRQDRGDRCRGAAERHRRLGPPARLRDDRGPGGAVRRHRPDDPARPQRTERRGPAGTLPRRRGTALQRREYRLRRPPGDPATGEEPHRPPRGEPHPVALLGLHQHRHDAGGRRPRAGPARRSQHHHQQPQRGDLPGRDDRVPHRRGGRNRSEPRRRGAGPAHLRHAQPVPGRRGGDRHQRHRRRRGAPRLRLRGGAGDADDPGPRPEDLPGGGPHQVHPPPDGPGRAPGAGRHLLHGPASPAEIVALMERQGVTLAVADGAAEP